MTELARLNVERQENNLVARLAGEVDASNAESLRRGIIAAMPETNVGLVLDLSEVEYIDSWGIRMLFLLDNQVQQRGKRLRAVVPDTAPIKGTLDCLGVGTVIPLDGALPEALAQ